MFDKLFEFLINWGFNILPQIILMFMLLVQLKGKWIVNKKIRIKEVVWNKALEKVERGQISIVGEQLGIGFLWGRKIFDVNDIEIVAGYSTDDYSAETWDEFLVLEFKNKFEIEIEKDLDERLVDWVRQYLATKNIELRLNDISYGTSEKWKVFYGKDKNYKTI